MNITPSGIPPSELESGCILRLHKTQCCETRLHPGPGIAQQIKIFQRASRVAELRLNAMPHEYRSVLPRKAVVHGSGRARCYCDVTRRQRIEDTINQVDDQKQKPRGGD